MSKTSFGHYMEGLRIHGRGEVEVVHSVQDDEYLLSCGQAREAGREASKIDSGTARRDADRMCLNLRDFKAQTR